MPAPGCASYDGLNLHAGVVIGANYPEGVERVVATSRGSISRSSSSTRCELKHLWSSLVGYGWGGVQSVPFEPTERYLGATRSGGLPPCTPVAQPSGTLLASSLAPLCRRVNYTPSSSGVLGRNC